MSSAARILVVEDEAILAEDLRETLQRQSFHVIDTVDNADDAIARAQEHQPDLVMLDIHLAGPRDGIAVAEIMHRELDVPVVFLTAHSDPATLDRAKATSPYGYLVKPFQEHELRATIETALYRHQADAQLRKMERWLRTTLHSIGDGVLSVDLTSRITFMNPVAERILGWSRRDALGQNFTDVFKLQDHAGIPVQTPLEPVLLAGETVHFDENYLIQTKSGERCRIDDSITPIRDGRQRITGAIVIFRDATEKWNLEQQRRSAEKRMQEAQRMESLGILAAGIAHDFNNLMAIVIGNTDLMRLRGQPNPDEKSALAEIRGAAHRAAELCDQMLSYSDNDNLAPMAPVDVTAIVTQTIELLKINQPESVTVQPKLPADPVAVSGNLGRLQQLVTNLLLNAFEASNDQPGTITISLDPCSKLPGNLRILPSTTDEECDRSWVRLSLQDEGCGMEAATVDRIFDPFFTTKFTGRGLGMAIVFNVIKLHDGGLQVTSTPGVGTRFDVYLPAAVAPPPAPSTPPCPISDELTLSGHALVVDDDESVRQLLATALLSLGIEEVKETAEHEEALGFLRQDDLPRVVLLDIVLPRTSGLDILRDLRRHHPHLPVILVSGYSGSSVSSAIANDPATIFLAKPFGFEDLIAALQKVVVPT